MAFLRGRPNSETIVNGMRAFFYLRCQNIQSNTPRLLSASLTTRNFENRALDLLPTFMEHAITMPAAKERGRDTETFVIVLIDVAAWWFVFGMCEALHGTRH